MPRTTTRGGPPTRPVLRVVPAEPAVSVDELFVAAALLGRLGELPKLAAQTVIGAGMSRGRDLDTATVADRVRQLVGMYAALDGCPRCGGINPAACGACTAEVSS